MIKLKSGSILIPAGDGSMCLVDLEKLHADLTESCRVVNIEEQELPSDIINVVMRFVNKRDNVSEAEINRLIVRILMDSGLHPLAESFADHRNITPEFILDEYIHPNVELVQEILNNEPFFLAKPINLLSTMVITQIGKMGFEKCGKQLLLELARNTWSQLQAKLTPQSYKYWLISRREFPKLLKGKPLELLLEKTIQIKSISSLLPSIQVTLHLSTFCKKLATDTTELLFYPAFNELLNKLATIRTQLLPEITARLSSIESDEIQLEIMIPDISELLKLFSSQKSEQKRTLKEMKDIIATTLLHPSISCRIL